MAFFYFDRYRPHNGDWISIVGFTAVEYADLLMEQAQYHRGATNLGAAISAIIDGNEIYEMDPVLDDESICCCKTILIIMTDG